MLAWPEGQFALFFTAFKRRKAVEFITQRKIAMQAGFLAGVWGNSNLDGDQNEGLREKMVVEMTEATEEQYEISVEKIYGYDRDAEIEAEMANDPFYAAIRVNYDEFKEREEGQDGG